MSSDAILIVVPLSVFAIAFGLGFNRRLMWGAVLAALMFLLGGIDWALRAFDVWRSGYMGDTFVFILLTFAAASTMVILFAGYSIGRVFARRRGNDEVAGE